jgi:hypothetical protein
VRVAADHELLPPVDAHLLPRTEALSFLEGMATPQWPFSQFRSALSPKAGWAISTPDERWQALLLAMKAIRGSFGQAD